MLHYKHKQHRHRRSQKFFHWSAKSTFCLSIPGCWRYNANGRSHNALPFLHHNENDPCYGNSPKNALCWQQGFFPHRITVRDLLQSAVIVSLHYLPQMSSTVTCGWTPTTATWSEPLLSCYCYAMKAILELTAPKFRNLPLQAVERTWVNCKLKIAWHHNSEPGSCAVWASYRKIKLSLQELGQLSCWLQVF